MEIPQGLRRAIENQIRDIEHVRMKDDAQAISSRYRTQSGKGKRLLTKETEAAAYAAARMPATFGAVSDALKYSLPYLKNCPQTLLDAGAGTGTAAWAADAELKLKKIICLEREDAMINIGKDIMKCSPEVLCNAEWIKNDLTVDEIPEQADLVIASYVLNEMSAEKRMETVKKLWDATKMMFLIIEPGTPVGFSNLAEIRQVMLKWGAHIAAPCPHESDCPKEKNDWCGFACRVSRSRLHRQLKGGKAPYEDEKFIYMAFTREKCHSAEARVLRHPQIHKGYVDLEICTKDGIKNIKLSKKDGEKYKKARKVKAGDEI